MVPCPCAGTGIPPPASARNTASAMRCDVSTFPAATALGERAFTRHPAGAVTRTARDTPPLVGMSSGKSVRTTNSTAERATASGQFTLPRAAAAVPVKSAWNTPSRTSTRTTIGRSTSSTPSPSSQSVATRPAASRGRNAARVRRSA